MKINIGEEFSHIDLCMFGVREFFLWFRKNDEELHYSEYIVIVLVRESTDED